MKINKNLFLSIGAGVLLMLGVSAHYSLAGTVVSPFDAGKRVGQYVTVQGQVTQVHVSRKGNIFLNMGGRYPHNAFTVVMFNRSGFSAGEIENLSGRQIRVKGYVKLYRGKPEIVLTEPAR